MEIQSSIIKKCQGLLSHSFEGSKFNMAVMGKLSKIFFFLKTHTYLEPEDNICAFQNNWISTLVNILEDSDLLFIGNSNFG